MAKKLVKKEVALDISNGINELKPSPKKENGLVTKFKSFWSWLRSDWKRMAGATVVVLLLVFTASKVFGSNSNKVTYQTASVAKGTVVETVSASGKALTTSALTINTGASGIVSTIFVKDGDVVAAGQKIASITLDSVGSQQYQQALSSYNSAVASVSSANANYWTQQNAEFVANQKFINDASARNLAANDPTYIEEWANWKAAEAGFINQQNQLAAAQASLSNAAINLQLASSTITAPYAGTISDINLVEGMVISSGNTVSSSSSNNATISTQRIAVIENKSTPIVNVSVSEIDVPSIKIGQKVTVTFDSISGKTFTGTVATVDRIGTVSSNVTSYGVNIKLDSGSDLILPNMAATADIITATATDVLEVPSSALVTQSDGSVLAKTLVSGKEVDVPVEVGISSDTMTEIRSGLTEGEIIITGTKSSGATPSSTRSVFGGSTFGGGGARIVTGRGG